MAAGAVPDTHRHLLYALLHPRDTAVDYLVYQSPYEARTGFYNLLATDSFTNFCIDYLYGVVRLHVPVLFSPEPGGVAMQVFVIAAWLATRPLRRGTDTPPGTGLLACLVLGHMAISMLLFEPDLGNYVRHLSNASLFCMVQMKAHGETRAALPDNHQRRAAAFVR
ncbi:hypothetical protein BRCH_03224 [Candidatus Burkholderia brachyanthoides]|nr:hypothetical protein BRCH_03224 [Candidatus Burkholderia brachyanthoides]